MLPGPGLHHNYHKTSYQVSPARRTWGIWLFHQQGRAVPEPLLAAPVALLPALSCPGPRRNRRRKRPRQAVANHNLDIQTWLSSLGLVGR